MLWQRPTHPDGDDPTQADAHRGRDRGTLIGLTPPPRAERQEHLHDNLRPEYTAMFVDFTGGLLRSPRLPEGMAWVVLRD